MLPKDLMEHSLWLNGPKLEYLIGSDLGSLDDEQQRTVNDAIKPNSLVLHLTKAEPFQILSYFSNHSKLLKRMSFITAFIKRIFSKLLLKTNCSHRERFNQLMTNLESPEILVFKMVQRECFRDELKSLQSGRDVSSNSTLRGLNPFIDGKGVLRVGGRLENANLSFDQRHPIILPKRHQVIKNLIAEAHDKTMHGTELLTASYLRNRFHIPRVSEKVRNFIHSCIKCLRFSRQQQEILMGSLPEVRVNITRSFQHTGVDHAGPITIKA